jgi:hypothetical protein
MREEPERHAYWRDRRNLLYYQVVRQLVEGLGQGAESMLDVGSAACPYLDWFPHIPVRVSLDIERPYRAAGVEAVTADFLEWRTDRRFDIVTCLQVMEHVEDPAAFAKKLLALGRTVIVSVPHAWPPGSVDGHRHDPVTERKMRSWFGREPNFSYVCREVLTHSDRLIQVYEPNALIWSNLRKRAKQQEALLTARHTSPPSRVQGTLRRLRKSPLPNLARRYWSQLRSALRG